MYLLYTKRALRLFFLIVIFDLACLPGILFKNPRVELGAQASRIDKVDIKIAQSPEGLSKYIGKFKVTFYWIVREDNYDGEKDTPLYLENGRVLGYFPYRFVQEFKKEACAELKDGKLISYLKRVNKVRVVRQFLGFNGYTISPFKSIAVDQAIIPLGSKLYIPALTKLTDHNGTVYAHDIGSMINGHDIDIFVGYKENTRLFTSAGIGSSSLVDVYLLE